MKKLIATLATVFVSLTALPEKVEASPHHHRIGHSYTYLSGHASCGCQVYKRRVVIGHDYYHRPVYRYYSVPIVHRCRRYVRPSYYGCSDYRGYSYRGRRGSHRSYTIRGSHGRITIRR